MKTLPTVIADRSMIPNNFSPLPPLETAQQHLKDENYEGYGPYASYENIK
jgi:hypothetical protein